MSTYFVALDADTYNIDAKKVALSYGQTISEWVRALEEEGIGDDDVVIGHSVGASVALIHGNGTIHAISPSPITEETKHLLGGVPKDELPFKEEATTHHLKQSRSELYVGEMENEIIKECVEVISTIMGFGVSYVRGATHDDIVDKCFAYPFTT